MWERQVRRAEDVKYRKSRGSTLTVLELKPPQPPACGFRLQPVGVMGLIETITQGTPTAVPTGDAAFDGAFALYTNNAAGALGVLTADVRRDILAFRTAAMGGAAAGRAGQLAASLVLGSFEIGPDRVAFSLFGTPSRRIGDQLLQAAPLLARLCRRPTR